MSSSSPRSASVPSGSSSSSSSIFDQPQAVWAIAFACTVGFMSIGLVDPILTSIARGLHANASQVSLLFTSYFLVTSVMMLITGFVSSRIGARPTLLLGAALIVVFSALAGRSSSVTELVLLRGGWGLGNAFFVVTALSVLVAVTRGGTGRAVLFYEAAIGLGLSGGPLVGALLGNWSWRWPFFGTATLMGVGLIAILLFLPRLPRPTQKISLVAPIAALRHPGLFTVAACAFFYYYAFFTVLAFVPFVLEMSPTAVGGIFFGWGLLLAIFSVFVAPRVEAHFGLIPVVTVCLVGLAAILLAMGVSPKIVVAGGAVLSGALMGICNTLFTELALEVSDAPRPVASAGYNFLRWFAGVIAPFAAPEIARTYGVEAAFAVAAVATLAAPAVLYLRRRHLSAHTTEEVRAEAATPAVLTPVMVAVDGSTHDNAVVAEAVSLAIQHNASLQIVHVRMDEVFADEAAELESSAEANRIITQAGDRVTPHRIAWGSYMLHVAAGAAVNEVAQLARRLKASHLVVGSAHVHDLDDLLHGSFSAALVAKRIPGVQIVVVAPPL